MLFIKKYSKKKLPIIVLLFVAMLQGCSWLNSVQNTETTSKISNSTVPLAPILESSKVVILDGEQGIWINEEDTAELLLWLYELESR